MRLLRLLLGLSLASVSAAAATIPPDLETRAAELRRQASPQLLAWAHDQGVARARGPIDHAALEQKIRSQLVVKRAASTTLPAGTADANRAVLGNMQGADIEALAFLVLMEASKSAQEDLKEIMAHVKAINNAKAQQRGTLQQVKQMAAATPTPTPAPDRAAELVAEARKLAGKAQGAQLSRVAPR